MTEGATRVDGVSSMTELEKGLGVWVTMVRAMYRWNLGQLDRGRGSVTRQEVTDTPNHMMV